MCSSPWRGCQAPPSSHGRCASRAISALRPLQEANSAPVSVLRSDGSSATVPASALKVGNLVILHKDQRVPADVVLLRTADRSGTCFIRTDQLDGETDWKLRCVRPLPARWVSVRRLTTVSGHRSTCMAHSVSVASTQALPSDATLFQVDAEVYGGRTRRGRGGGGEARPWSVQRAWR